MKTESGHKSGPDCPACPEYHTWIENHCYHCGEPFDRGHDHERCFQ